MLVFQSLLSSLERGIDRHNMLVNRVESFLNNVCQQTAFHQFESKMHIERRQGALTAERIGQLWMETQQASLGPSFRLDSEYSNYWSYIPHFIHSPFYVYAYAFGDCLVNSLYRIYENGLKNFEKKYFILLQSGGSKKYNELLKPFELDPTKKNFWTKGLTLIEDLIDDLEKL